METDSHTLQRVDGYAEENSCQASFRAIGRNCIATNDIAFAQVLASADTDDGVLDANLYGAVLDQLDFSAKRSNFEFITLK